MNLYRLPSDQLSFLQQYVEKLNNEAEEQKGKLVEDWKAAIRQEEQERFEKEMKRTEGQMKLLDLKRQYLKERRQDSETSAEKPNQGERGAKKTITRNRGRCGNRYEYDSDGTAREAPVNIYDIPAPPRYRGRYAPPRPYRESGPSPATFETPWTIEEVELTFIPEKLSLVPALVRHTGLQSYRMPEPGEKLDDIRRGVKLEVATNVIAPESFSSFAVVLSRCHGVERPCDITPAHHRDYSPARSYYSDVMNQYDAEEEEEWAESVEKADDQRMGIFMGYPPPPPWNQTGAPVPRNVEGENNPKDPSEAGNDEDAFETESKTGEEGEDCGEGTVYINAVKKTG